MMPSVLIPAFILLVLSMPLALDMIPRNRFYGIRTPKTMSNDSLWYAGNSFGGVAIMAATCTYITFAFYAVFNQGKHTFLEIKEVHMLFLFIPLTIALVITHFYIKRL